MTQQQPYGTKKVIPLRMPIDLNKRATKRAEELDVTLSYYVNSLVASDLGADYSLPTPHEEKKHPAA